MNRYVERFSLPYPHRYAAAEQIACRIQTYGIEHVCLQSVPFLPYPHAAYMESQLGEEELNKMSVQMYGTAYLIIDN